MTRKKGEIRKNLDELIPILKATSKYMANLKIENAYNPNNETKELIRSTAVSLEKMEAMKKILEDALEKVDE